MTTLRVCPACRLASAALPCACGVARLALGDARDRLRLTTLVASRPAPRVAAVATDAAVVGRITEAVDVIAPTDGATCVAWAVELRTADGQVTLRVGHTAGLIIALAGGDRLEVPAGPVWIVAPAPAGVRTPWLFEEALRAVDPPRAPAVELTSPIPFASVHAATLQLGDAVGVVGLAAAGDAEVALGPAGAYRTAARPIARLTQLPVLGRVADATA